MSVTSVGRLRRFASRVADHTACDLCRSELTERHRHLLELEHRRMLCACDGCALLFSDPHGNRFRPIPRSVSRIDLNLCDQAWAGLGIPIGMAYFTVREPADSTDPIRAPVMVGYPSPAGPVVSSVENHDWQALLDENPAVGRMRPEVETLLVNRTAKRRQAFIVPLDLCYELIGIVRRHWEGWSGGPNLHREIHSYFDQLELTSAGASQA